MLEYVILYQDDIQALDIVTANGKDMVYRYLDGGVLLVKEFTADPSAIRLYHISCNRLGSVEKVTGGDGEPVFEAGYDEWGRQSVSTNKIGFIRGYTGHEMLPEFGLINMNGRMYDPLLARFLSPDDYVQMPMSPQGFNRYSYCMNNPMRYTDPSGELFGLSIFTGFLKGFGKFIHKGDFRAIFDETIKNFNNEVRLASGFFRGNTGQILSRLTWESLQTAIGYMYNDYMITFHDVSFVDYFDGATYIVRKSNQSENAVTIGSFIHIKTTDEIPLDSKGHIDPTQNPLYMHEYGHYLQSQSSGFGYLFKYGIPSLMSASISRKMNIAPFSTHRITTVEKDANKRAAQYFKKYGVNWKEDKRYYKDGIYSYSQLYPTR